MFKTLISIFCGNKTTKQELHVPEETGHLPCRAIIRLALDNGWEVLDTSNSPGMISFKRDYYRMNVYFTTMTVGVQFKKPGKPAGQFFRKKVSKKQLKLLFVNPFIRQREYYR